MQAFCQCEHFVDVKFFLKVAAALGLDQEYSYPYETTKLCVRWFSAAQVVDRREFLDVFFNAIYE